MSEQHGGCAAQQECNTERAYQQSLRLASRLSILLSLSYAAVGFNGRVGFSKLGNTH